MPSNYGGEVIYKALSSIINNWDEVTVRVDQDGERQTLHLSEIKDASLVANWIIRILDAYTTKEDDNGGRV